LAETALWLSGSVTREPGVPIFADVPLASNSRLDARSQILLAGPRWGRNGAHIVRIECAAAHDLAATPIAQLSRAQGWADHVDHAGRRGGASSAKRAVREGRLLLHQLGAWPWAHVDRGRLHDSPEWWCAPEFLTPLRRWIARSWARLLFNELSRHRQATILEPSQGDAARASEASFAVLENTCAATIVALDAESLLEVLPGPRTP